MLPPVDYDMACGIHAYLRDHRLNLRLKETIEGFSERNGMLLTLLKGREPVESDFVILAIGVLPETRLAKEAGLALGAKDAIVVNERMETSKPDI